MNMMLEIFVIQHYDLYRLTDYSEIKNIGLFENRKEIVTLIEWPEKIENKLLIIKLIYFLNIMKRFKQKVFNN